MIRSPAVSLILKGKKQALILYLEKTKKSTLYFFLLKINDTEPSGIIDLGSVSLIFMFEVEKNQ